MARVVAVGLDAAEWSVVEALIDGGELPHLARMRAEGSSCRLRNVVPYRSELPWTQFLTGRDASATRYWSTVVFEPETYDAYCIGAHDDRPFYELGDDVEVIAFDLPHSVLREGLRGAQVTKWGAHSAQYPRASRPRGLLREIDARFGVHPALDNDYDGGWHQPRFLQVLGDALVDGAGRRAEIGRWLMERFPDWDLFVTVLSESHSAGHHFWHGVDPDHPLHPSFTGPQARRELHRVYRALDAAVGELAASLEPDDYLVVFAVHGMQVNRNDVPSLALLPELAHRLHFGAPLVADASPDAWARRGFPPVRPPERLSWREAVYKRFAATPAARRRRAVRLGLPDPLVGAARGVQRRLTGRPRLTWEFDEDFAPESDDPVESLAGRRQPLAWQMPYRYRPWWPRMRWFVLPTFSDAHVRLNLAGRERDGLIDVADYERACDEVEATLRACTDPRTGRPAVAEVVRVRATDPLAPDGPDADLVVLWAEACDALTHPEVGTVGPLPYLRTGEHSANGFALITGPGVPVGDLGERPACDVTPTVVHLLGRELDPAFAGRPLLSPAPVG